ncbi:MAG: OmpA family protein [Mycobacteriaceae bacterium]
MNGFADALPYAGDPGGNLMLSLQRATAVSDWFVAHGVDRARLQVVPHGDSNPLAPDGTNGQPANRTVLVVINPVRGG